MAERCRVECRREALDGRACNWPGGKRNLYNATKPCPRCGGPVTKPLPVGQEGR